LANQGSNQYLLNPFTPSEIASGPDDFFGRAAELRLVRDAIQVGSVAIEGPVGIGKSSLLARTRLELEGFGTDRLAFSVIAVGDRDVKTVDEAARLVLESLISVDETQKKVSFKISSFFEWGSTEIVRNFEEGRHLATLKRLLEKQTLRNILADQQLLTIAIDEADKCPIAVARLIRSVATHTQQHGIRNIRFLLAGVTPFIKEIQTEDPGVARFIYRVVTLYPMPKEEATDLLYTKLGLLEEDAQNKGVPLTIDPHLVPRIVALSGGHPHLLQLLGAYLVQHESEDPDGIIDSRDLIKSMRRIAYEDRAQIYESTLHRLELEDKLDAFLELISIAKPGFPTRISRRQALDLIDKEALHWLGDFNILKVGEGEYGLIDEFLRVRILLDEGGSDSEQEAVERRLASEEYSDATVDPELLYWDFDGEKDVLRIGDEDDDYND
jgi:hypothetical protein